MTPDPPTASAGDSDGHGGCGLSCLNVPASQAPKQRFFFFPHQRAAMVGNGAWPILPVYKLSFYPSFGFKSNLEGTKKC